MSFYYITLMLTAFGTGGQATEKSNKQDYHSAVYHYKLRFTYTSGKTKTVWSTFQCPPHDSCGFWPIGENGIRIKMYNIKRIVAVSGSEIRPSPVIVRLTTRSGASKKGKINALGGVYYDKFARKYVKFYTHYSGHNIKRIDNLGRRKNR